VTDRSPRFLLVRLGSLGDVIHAIPAAAALRKRYPHGRIDWMVDPQYMPVVRLVRAVDRVIPVNPRGGAAKLYSAFRAFWGSDYDAAIDLQGLLKSAVLARVAVPRRVVGFPKSQLREPAARLFYSAAMAPPPTRHVIEKNLALLRAVDVIDSEVSFPLTIPQTDAVDAVAAQCGAGRYVLINPGAAWPNKRWPPERFGALARAIRERIGLSSLVLWGPGEQTLAREVAERSAGAATMAPRTDTTDLFGIARQAALMISGDTGPLHIAGAVGTPLVALFGPTDSRRNGPWSSSDVTVTRFDRCSCHYERRCRFERPCIEDIAAEEVLEAVQRRLR
jgi:lipopolysaccharide heptosyltransferase I